MELGTEDGSIDTIKPPALTREPTTQSLFENPVMIEMSRRPAAGQGGGGPPSVRLWRTGAEAPLFSFGLSANPSHRRHSPFGKKRERSSKKRLTPAG